MSLTVISHFYNEEFLLPYWLDHHKRIFDHGILIDYDSTDGSTAIIKEMVPGWELRTSRNRTFDAFAVDAEVMEIERELSGWKMALNTTEFLLCHDVRKVLREARQVYPNMSFRTSGIWLVDCPHERNHPIDQTPLFFQRWHGIYGNSRNRLIHDQKDGEYDCGRHSTKRPSVILGNMYCVWAGWAPYYCLKNRKLQIKTRIPSYHLGSGLGAEHQVGPEQMDAQFDKLSKQAVSLLSHADYVKELRLVRDVLYPELTLQF